MVSRVSTQQMQTRSAEDVLKPVQLIDDVFGPNASVRELEGDHVASDTGGRIGDRDSTLQALAIACK